MESKTQTISNLKTKLAGAWLRGKEQRIEIGKLLLELREHAKHGEWGKWMAELQIPCSTAIDYMTEASREKHGTRRFEGGQVVTDPDEQQMRTLVSEQTALVEADREPEQNRETAEPIILEDRTRVLGPVLYCSANQREAYKAAKKADVVRVYCIFHKALLEVIDVAEPTDDQTGEVASAILAA
jgi:hypothetical protein